MIILRIYALVVIFVYNNAVWQFKTFKQINNMETNQKNNITSELYLNGKLVDNIHPISYLSLSDLISLHGWIDSEADLIEALGGDNTARLEEAREQMTTIHKEIERRRGNLFGNNNEEKKLD